MTSPSVWIPSWKRQLNENNNHSDTLKVSGSVPSRPSSKWIVSSWSDDDEEDDDDEELDDFFSPSQSASWKKKNTASSQNEDKDDNDEEEEEEDENDDYLDEDLSANFNPGSAPSLLTFSTSCPSRIPFKNSGFARGRSNSKLSKDQNLIKLCHEKAFISVDPLVHPVDETGQYKHTQLNNTNVNKVLKSIETAMKEEPHLEPVQLSSEGVNGSYFLRNRRGQIKGIFKPQDEEDGAENNPRRPSMAKSEVPFENILSATPEEPSQPLTLAKRHGIPPGEAAIREVIAYLIDRDGFLHVPVTVMANACYFSFHQKGEDSHSKRTDSGSLATFASGSPASSSDIASSSFPASQAGSHSSSAVNIQMPSLSAKDSHHPLSPSPPDQHSPSERRSFKTKKGSFQFWAPNDGSCEDVGVSLFPADDVHRIGILDIILLNTDRHSGNILWHKDFRTKSYSLIPIDHGFCLPDSLEHIVWFDWMSWAQSKQPFTQQTLDYIAKINIQENMAILKQNRIPPKCIELCEIAHIVLQNAAKYGFNLFEIASIFCRSKFFDQPSQLEVIIDKAKKRSSRVTPSRAGPDPQFIEHFTTILESHLKKQKLDSN